MNSSKPILRIGSVSYLNARPLIYGLEKFDDIELHLAVPAKLLDGLKEGKYDVALLPVIDYQRMDGLVIVPAGGIGSDGPTLTVRIFSRVPVSEIRSLACDTESHTSVALARIILAESYGIHPEFCDRAPGKIADAELLIGDKVVCEAPADYSHFLDLGEAWKNLTGMPFVFAVWMARAGIDLRDLPQRLIDSKKQGLAHLPEIIERYALPIGWPRDLAMQYLSQNLQFDVNDTELNAIRRFYSLATRHQIIPSARTLKIHQKP